MDRISAGRQLEADVHEAVLVMLTATAGDQMPVLARELPVLVPVPVSEARVVEAAGGTRGEELSQEEPVRREEPSDGGE